MLTVLKSGSLNLLERSGPVQACNGIALTLPVDLKQEDSEALTFPQIKTEPELSVWGLCVRQKEFMFPRPFAATKENI